MTRSVGRVRTRTFVVLLVLVLLCIVHVQCLFPQEDHDQEREAQTETEKQEERQRENRMKGGQCLSPNSFSEPNDSMETCCWYRKETCCTGSYGGKYLRHLSSVFSGVPDPSPLLPSPSFSFSSLQSPECKSLLATLLCNPCAPSPLDFVVVQQGRQTFRMCTSFCEELFSSCKDETPFSFYSRSEPSVFCNFVMSSSFTGLDRFQLLFIDESSSDFCFSTVFDSTSVIESFTSTTPCLPWFPSSSSQNTPFSPFNYNPSAADPPPSIAPEIDPDNKPVNYKGWLFWSALSVLIILIFTAIVLCVFLIYRWRRRPHAVFTHEIVYSLNDSHQLAEDGTPLSFSELEHPLWQTQ